jgi:hypothetical protein
LTRHVACLADILTLFPSELLLAGARGEGAGGARDFLRATQCFKVLRLIRVFESFDTARRRLITGSIYVSFAETALLTLLLFHWATCIWYLSASRQYFWRENSAEFGGGGGDNTQPSCAVRGDVLDPSASHSFRYLCSVHFSLQLMSTVGCVRPNPTPRRP